MICPNCGETVGDGAFQCSSCGGRLHSTTFVKMKSRLDQLEREQRLHRGPTVMLDEPRDRECSAPCPEPAPALAARKGGAQPSSEVLVEPKAADRVDAIQGQTRKVLALRRAAACLIDLLILAGLAAATLKAVAYVGDVSAYVLLRYLPAGVAILLLFEVLLYFITFTTLTGQSIGMIPMGLRITAVAGGRPALMQALIRSIIHIMSLFLPVLFLPVLCRRDERTLSDLMSGTRSVRLDPTPTSDEEELTLAEDM